MSMHEQTDHFFRAGHLLWLTQAGELLELPVGAGPCACPAWECLIANFGMLKTPS
jgi:hypothetical protein